MYMYVHQTYCEKMVGGGGGGKEGAGEEGRDGGKNNFSG